MPALTAAKVTIAAPKKTVGRQALKVQANLQQSGERADLNEQALAKMKAQIRASSVGPM